jgi:hypothetical protein
MTSMPVMPQTGACSCSGRWDCGKVCADAVLNDHRQRQRG